MTDLDEVSRAVDIQEKKEIYKRRPTITNEEFEKYLPQMLPDPDDAKEAIELCEHRGFVRVEYYHLGSDFPYKVSPGWNVSGYRCVDCGVKLTHLKGWPHTGIDQLLLWLIIGGVLLILAVVAYFLLTLNHVKIVLQMPDPNSLIYIVHNFQQLNITEGEMYTLLDKDIIYYCPMCRCYHISEEYANSPDEGWETVDGAIARHNQQ